MVLIFTTILLIIQFYLNMLFLYFLNGVLENNGIIIIIGHFQVHIFASSYWPTNLQKNNLNVNSIYLIVIREIIVKSILVFICDLLRNAISSI